MRWRNAEERFEVTGWLGDAVYTGTDNRTSFENDDYIADIDADNIVHRTRNGTPLANSVIEYYSSINKDDNDYSRTKEFLKNHTYEEIEEKVIDSIRFSRPIVSNEPYAETYHYGNSIDNPAYESTKKFLEKLESIKNRD